jgi:tetratricopeptide (TPR) repeat protein
LGEVYFNKGVIDLAIKNFEEAIMLDSSSAEAHFLLGFALGEKGKIQESLNEVKKAIAINPALAQFEPNLPINIREHRGHWEFLKEQLGVPKISANEYEVHFNMGTTYLNKGLFDESKREFDECLKLNPENPDLNLALGQVYLFMNKYDDAIKHLQKAYEKDYDSSDCTNALGVAYCLKGEFNEAEDWFRKTLSLEKDFAKAINNLAVTCFNQGKIEEAVENYEKAIDLGSQDSKFNLGMYYFKNAEYDKALKLFEGKTADDYFGKGLVFMETGKDEEAVELFKKTAAVLPNHAGAYYSMGFVLTKIGQFEEGLGYIRKGMEIEPNYEKEKYRLCLAKELSTFGPYYTPKRSGEIITEEIKEVFPTVEGPSANEFMSKAETYLSTNEFDEALSMVEEVIKIEPAWSKAVILKAEILFQYGNVDDALNYLGNYAKSHPENTEVLATTGRLLKEIERFSEAREVYLKLVELEEDNTGWLSEVANISYNVGDLDDALKVYTRIYNKNNDDINANLGLLRIHLKNKDFASAKNYLDFFEKRHPDVYEYNTLAGVYWKENDDRKKASRHLQKAIELDSSKPLPYYHLGLLQVQEGKFENASDNWKKALLLSPDEELADKIRHCLKMTVELTEFLKKEI